MDACEEIGASIETLHRADQRLEELTAGEVDTVADRNGRTLLLRRAQDHMRHFEAARQAAILNALPAHIALLDAQGRIVSVNEAWRRFAGANVLSSPESGIGLNYLGICDSARGDGAAEARQAAAGIRAVLSGETKRFSIEYPCHSPMEQRWFLLKVTPLAEDRQNGAVVMHLDITERKRAEEALRLSEARFRSLTAMSSDFYWESDTEHRLTARASANKKLSMVSAFQRGAQIGERRWEIPNLSPDAAGWQAHRAVLDAHLPFRDFHLSRLGGDGTERHISISGDPVFDASGAFQGYRGVGTDITERKRAEDALRESESRLSAVFQASPIGISVSRVADGTFLEINDAALRMFGYARDEVIGRTAVDLGNYVNPAQRADLIAQLREHGQVERFEIDFRHRSGAVGKMELTGRVIELKGEQCLVAMMLDVTERNRLEEVHLQAQKLESLGTLAGGIAHDFNNILAAIHGNADLAAEDVGPDHIAAESLEEIRTASVRASELVRRIMAFGRPREVQQEVVDLGAVVSEVLKLLRSTLPAGIALRKAFDDATPHVLADAGQIHEAVVNLTTNAAYAIGPRPGSIEYRLDPVEVGEKLEREIPGLEQGRYARLTVSDSGCGMDAATLERIFDAFYTTKPVGEGTGLGLSMLHGTMRSFGGAVTVVSAPGKGASFALYFPAASQKSAENDAIAPVPIVLSAGQRVLYVDDEEALVFLANRVLSRLGHRITSFTDPEKALEAFRAHPQDFDIVVTDLSMPHMSGLELAREVLAARADMPVLMTTGYLRPEDVESARALGVRELMLKPVTMDELSRKLDRLFRDSPMQD